MKQPDLALIKSITNHTKIQNRLQVYNCQPGRSGDCGMRPRPLSGPTRSCPPGQTRPSGGTWRCRRNPAMKNITTFDLMYVYLLSFAEKKFHKKYIKIKYTM